MFWRISNLSSSSPVSFEMDLLFTDAHFSRCLPVFLFSFFVSGTQFLFLELSFLLKADSFSRFFGPVVNVVYGLSTECMGALCQQYVGELAFLQSPEYVPSLGLCRIFGSFPGCAVLFGAIVTLFVQPSPVDICTLDTSIMSNRCLGAIHCLIDSFRDATYLAHCHSGGI